MLEGHRVTTKQNENAYVYDVWQNGITEQATQMLENKISVLILVTYYIWKYLSYKRWKT